MEVLIALGAISIISAATMAFYSRVETRVKVASDVENLRSLASAIERSHGVLGSYRGLSASSTVEDNLAPADFRRAATASLTNAWGGGISISPFTVRTFGDSYVAAFYGVPTKACAPFLSALAGDPSVLDVRVDDVSAKWDRGGQLDVPTLVAACKENGNVLEVVYFSGMASGGSVATLIPPALPVPGLAADSPAVTPTGPISTAPAVSDALLVGPGAALPGVPSPATPAMPDLPPAAATPLVPQPSPVRLPPTSPAALVPCRQAESQAQTPTCPAGTWGTETLRTRTVCPDEGVDPNTDAAWERPEAWARPVVVTKKIASNCEACPVPSNQQTTQWIASAQACPSGQTGTHTWEREQVARRPVTYHCPAGTTALPSPIFGGWSAWANTGNRRNEANTCVSSASRCADGSLQVAAWYSAVVDDLPPPPGSSGVGYWYHDSVVGLTAAEKTRLAWAIQNIPVTRTETPAPMPGNWPANVNESASYAEQCSALGDVGNINYAYSYEFECVSNMGMHYCDYNSTSGGTSMAVCRQACAADLVGKTNNPYRWEWPESYVVSATPSVTCTGQPGCAPNGGYGSQSGLPACTETNVGQAIAYRWYRQFYSPPRIDVQEFNVTCRGPKP